MCNFSQTFVTLFQPSALDGNRSAWLVLELTSWIIVSSQLHSSTWFTHSVWLDVEEPESSVYLAVHVSRAFSWCLKTPALRLLYKKFSHLSLITQQERWGGGTKKTWPSSSTFHLCCGAVCVVSNFRCCKPLCVTPLCLFGLDYISLAVNTFLFSPLKCKSVLKAEKDSIVKWFLW